VAWRFDKKKRGRAYGWEGSGGERLQEALEKTGGRMKNRNVREPN
jgi:hypothetical protein